MQHLTRQEKLLRIIERKVRILNRTLKLQEKREKKLNKKQ